MREIVYIVMPALVAGIHVFSRATENKTWMRGSSPRMTAGMDARVNRAFTPVFDGLCPRMTQKNYAAFCLAWISLRLIRHSAIWMALSAAPLRRLSETTHSTRPLSTVGSVRMRLM